MIQQFDLDINCNLWLDRLQSPAIHLKRDGVGPAYHYHTPRDLQTRPEFYPLLVAIEAGLPPGFEFIDLWANCMTRGNVRTLHDHMRPETGVSLCGCLYLTAGSQLVFPREAPPLTITPRPGLLVIFPPNRLHYVEPSDSAERWSVAFNAREAAHD